jgi:uncharacterized PurR-regulated membrane protein YhhQ (DUF165 family)
MFNNRIIGIVSITFFLASIPFANWWLANNGMWVSPFLGPLPSALWVVAISFVLRDIAQITIGKTFAWSAIAAGTVLSWWLASPTLAVASGAAFLISESTDAAIFTPLADRGRFLLGVTISGYMAGFIDSAVFLRIAFGSWDGWWQLGIAKAIVILAATPIAWGIRRVVLRQPVQR